MRRPPTAAGLGRSLLRWLGWGALSAALLIALAVALPLAFGARPHTVLTGSMEPAISPGDVVIDDQVAPREVAIGDVVTFRDPEDQSRQITHRVVRIRPAGGHYWFVTRGDANNTTEHWRIASGGHVGRVVYTVPWVGHIAVFARSPTGLAALLLVPLALLLVEELVRIWRPREAAGKEPRDARQP